MANTTVGSALCFCNKGSAPALLLANPSRGIWIEGKAVATIADIFFSTPFGVCSITKKPCQFVPSGNWLSPMGSSVLFGLQPALVQGAKLPCVTSGIVDVVATSQATLSIGLLTSKDFLGGGIASMIKDLVQKLIEDNHNMFDKFLGPELGKESVPQAVIDHLKLREGWPEDNRVYLDSLGNPTAGLGHLLTPSERARYNLGDRVPIKTLEAWARKDAQKAYNAARSQANTLGVRNQAFINAMASVNFQLGTGWRNEHRRTWRYMVAHEWEKAAMEAENSSWYAQTPVRVRDFQAALRALR
jgi:lysozyme